MVNEQSITVLDKDGRKLNNCSYKRARKLVGRQNAFWVDKGTIKLKINKADRKELRRKAIEKANRTCYICDIKIDESEPATLDHVVPKSTHGKNTLKNLKCCCKRCNNDKGNRDLLEYVHHIRESNGGYSYLGELRLNYLYELGLEYVKH